MYLRELRGKIDEIDSQIISLLAQRLQLVKQVGQYKLDNICTIRDKLREGEILDRIRNLATEHQLDFRVIERIFKILFRYYSGEQAKLRPARSTRLVK